MAPHDLAKHALLPVPSLKDHKSPDGREETLRTIIKNIETQQQQVRSNIIAANQSRYQELKKQQQQQQQQQQEQQANSTRPSSSDSTDAMDIDTATTPSEGEITPGGATAPTGNTGHDLLLSNLNATYNGISRENSVNDEGSLPPPPPEIRQATPPLEIRVAKETFDQLDQYDTHAKKSKGHYEQALERTRKNSNPMENTRDASSAHASAGVSRRSSGQTAFDPGRDPRTRPR